jgi:hypothetical protein
MISTSLARFRENMTAAGISQATGATLCGLKPSTLSSAFREIMSLGGLKEAELMTCSFRLLELREAMKPLDLPQSIGALEKLLERLTDGSITPDTIRTAVDTIFGGDNE